MVGIVCLSLSGLVVTSADEQLMLSASISLIVSFSWCLLPLSCCRSSLSLLPSPFSPEPSLCLLVVGWWWPDTKKCLSSHYFCMAIVQGPVCSDLVKAICVFTLTFPRLCVPFMFSGLRRRMMTLFFSAFFKVVLTFILCLLF